MNNRKQKGYDATSIPVPVLRQIHIYLQRNAKSETMQVDGKSTEENNESCKKSIFMTLFFTGWIFVIVEKCVSVS